MNIEDSALKKCMSVDCPYISVECDAVYNDARFYCDFIPMSETLDYVKWCFKWPEDGDNK